MENFKLLVSLTLRVDVEFTVCEMNRRNIPIEVRPDRTPGRVLAQLQARPFPEGPLAGLKIRKADGPGMWELVDLQGNVGADVHINGVAKVTWREPTTPYNAPKQMAIELALRNHIASLVEALDRPAVRRIYKGWLEMLGFVDTGVPALYEADYSEERLALLDQLLDTLPEAEINVWKAEIL